MLEIYSLLPLQMSLLFPPPPLSSLVSSYGEVFQQYIQFDTLQGQLSVAQIFPTHCWVGEAFTFKRKTARVQHFQ